MRNFEVELRNHLAANLPAGAGVGSRVFAEVRLPAGYKPVDGSAVLIRTAGGNPDYAGIKLDAVLQIECYGTDLIQASKADRAVFDLLNSKRVCGGFARCTTLGVPLEDPETEWRFYLSYYTLHVINR
jgi:hypothetical protein